jgi:hypothetical protein
LYQKLRYWIGLLPLCRFRDLLFGSQADRPGQCLHCPHLQHALPYYADDGSAYAGPGTAAGRWECHQELSTRRYQKVVEKGVFYGQLHREPVEAREGDQLITVGGHRFGTRVERVYGGYLVNGRKFFVSRSGATHYHAIPALLVADGPWQDRTLYLAIPRDAPGATFTGDWDPLGIRATVSWDMMLQDVLVPADAEILSPRVFGNLYQRQLYLFLGFSATFLGLMQQLTISPSPTSPAGCQAHRLFSKQRPPLDIVVVQILFALEAIRALYYHTIHTISEERLDPLVEAVQCARAAHVQVQQAVVQLTGSHSGMWGRTMLRRYPLERYYREARVSAVMRPWTQDIATQQAWETALTTTAH